MEAEIRVENNQLIINDDVELHITVAKDGTINIDTYKYIPREELEEDFDEHDFDEDYIDTFYIDQI